MANVKISGITASGTTINDTDVIEIELGADGSSAKLAGSVIKDVIRDLIGTTILAGTNITKTVNGTTKAVTLDAAGSGGGSTPRRHPGYKSGRWYRPPYAATNSALSTANVVAYPWAIMDTVTVTDLSIYVVTNIAGANVKVGVYAHDTASNGPGAKLAEGNIAPGGSAASASVTLGTPLALTAGLYWILSVADQGITTVNTYSTDASLGALLGTVNAQTTRIENAISYAATYASGLPADASAQAWAPAQIAAPAVAIKAQ